jgi:hypothetical protein
MFTIALCLLTSLTLCHTLSLEWDLHSYINSSQLPPFLICMLYSASNLFSFVNIHDLQTLVGLVWLYGLLIQILVSAICFGQNCISSSSFLYNVLNIICWLSWLPLHTVMSHYLLDLRCNIDVCICCYRWICVLFRIMSFPKNYLLICSDKFCDIWWQFAVLFYLLKIACNYTEKTDLFRVKMIYF